MLASWAPKTQSSYNSHLKKWRLFCSTTGVKPFEASFEEGTNFIEHLYNEGHKYGYIAAARSALSAILPKVNNETFGKSDSVSRMIKGIFKMRPTLPRYTAIYDASLVLAYIEKLPENEHLSLEMLTRKLTCLLCLLSGQRAQAISALNLDYYSKDHISISFYIPKIMKNTKPGKHQEPLRFQHFPINEKLCVVKCFEEYRRRTELIRENLEGAPKQLILSFAYPHMPVGTQTLARYVKNFLLQAGIDITVFTAHSTRKASSNMANNLGLSLKDINKAAGWFSKNTFADHYKLPIKKNFAKVILEGVPT